MRGVFLNKGVLLIREGDGYYDTNVSFETKNIIRSNEEVGVRGGHVGWQITYLKPVSGELKQSEWDFGRKLKWAMEEVNKLIQEFPDQFPKATITQEFDKAQKCY